MKSAKFFEDYVERNLMLPVPFHNNLLQIMEFHLMSYCKFKRKIVFREIWTLKVTFILK